MGIRIKRKKTPTVLQMEAVECGAASLRMILGYYKKYVPLEQLRRDCDVNRDGTNAKNIITAAERYGLEGAGYTVELEDLNEVEVPAIIFWQFNHFVVLEGINKKYAFLNDPAIGHRKVTIQEFGQSFTGIVLEFEPTENFKQSGQKSNLINGIKSRLKGYGKDLIYIFLIGLLLAVPEIIIPVFTKFFIDEILILKGYDWILKLIIGMIITTIFRSYLEYIKQKKLLNTRNKLDLVTTSKYFWHVLRLPIIFFTQRYRGNIGRRIMLNPKVTELVANKLANNLLDILLIIFYFLIMWYYDKFMALIVVGLSLFNILAIKLISDKRAEGYLSWLMEKSKMSGVAMGGIRTIETLKAMGRENDFFASWAGYYTKVTNVSQKTGVYTLLLNTVPVLVFSLCNMIIIVVGANKVIDGMLTIGTLVAFQSLMTSFNRPIENLVNLAGEIQETAGDMEHLDDVLNSDIDPIIEEWEKNEGQSKVELGSKLKGSIEFKNVTFGYSLNSPPLIENLSLKIESGQQIAFVGSSGSGKSTIINLLNGLLKPWSGEILFDGKPRHDYPRENITNSISMVSQEVFLFEGTVKDILSVWDESITEEMLKKATKDACVDDVIKSKSRAYDYFLTEGGKNLSGGQRQRLEIARSLTTNPSILVLDEATSALDPVTEKLVMDNIHKRKCSVVIVAHRLSTIRDSDEIIVLKDGKVAERGKHKMLINNKGEYARLIEN